MGILIVISCLAWFLIRRIRKNYQKGSYYHQDYYDKDSFSSDKISAIISAINGDPVSFLISNITSVFLVQAQLVPSIITYVIINFMIFVMMIKTYNIQPNLFIVLAGIDIIKTKHNQFLIVLNDSYSEEDSIDRLIPEEDGRLHVVGEIDN